MGLIGFFYAFYVHFDRFNCLLINTLLLLSAPDEWQMIFLEQEKVFKDLSVTQSLSVTAKHLSTHTYRAWATSFSQPSWLLHIDTHFMMEAAGPC